MSHDALVVMVSFVLTQMNPCLLNILGKMKCWAFNRMCYKKCISWNLHQYCLRGQRSLRAFSFSPRTLYSVKPFPEGVDITIATYDQPSPDLPSELQSAWSEGVETLLQVLHPRARHVKLSGADHTVFYAKPHVVANAIIDMAMRLRSHLVSPKE